MGGKTMFKQIKRFITRLFNDKIFAKLCFEILVFSMLLGIGFKSWIIFGLIFFGLSWLLHQFNGKIYTVIALSCVWGFIAASIGYSFGGWLWAAILGIIVLIKGIRVYWRKLELSWVDWGLNSNNLIEWQRNGYLGRQNLN